MTTIGWFSDTHLGATQYGLLQRRQDFQDAFEFALRDMLDCGIRAILHTGDLLNSNRPDAKTMLFLRDMQQLLIASKATLYVINGNHDSGETSWYQLFNTARYGIRDTDWQQLTLDCGSDGPYIRVFGLPFVHPSEYRKLNLPSADLYMMHQPLREFLPQAADDMLSISELPHDCLAVLLGDIHKPGMLPHPKNPKCMVGYPGSTEMCDASQTHVKAWVEVQIDTDTRTCQYVPHHIKVRPVIMLSCMELAETQRLEQELAQIVQQVERSEQAPIVIFRYSRKYSETVNVLRTMLDPKKYIVRLDPQFVEADKAWTSADVQTSELNLLDLADNLLQKPHLKEVMRDLLCLEKDPTELLRLYVRDRLTPDKAPAA